ncbi:MAG: hypothetical protein OHK0022_46570 [Roseiflexaceae bacterium]
MTYELEVLAGQPGFVSWGELRENILAAFDEHDRLRWGTEPGLAYKGQAVDVTETLQENRLYHFTFQSPTTLSLMPHLFVPLKGEESLSFAQGLLLDYGVNIYDPAIINTIAEQWVDGGHSYTLFSTKNRAQGEIALMIKICAVLAKIRRGFVVIQDSSLVLAMQGVFTAEEFSEFESLQDDE